VTIHATHHALLQRRTVLHVRAATSADGAVQSGTAVPTRVNVTPRAPQQATAPRRPAQQQRCATGALTLVPAAQRVKCATARVILLLSLVVRFATAQGSVDGVRASVFAKLFLTRVTATAQRPLSHRPRTAPMHQLVRGALRLVFARLLRSEISATPPAAQHLSTALCVLSATIVIGALRLVRASHKVAHVMRRVTRPLLAAAPCVKARPSVSGALRQGYATAVPKHASVLVVLQPLTAVHTALPRPCAAGAPRSICALRKRKRATWIARPQRLMSPLALTVSPVSGAV
jgi:hypothetical protein